MHKTMGLGFLTHLVTAYVLAAVISIVGALNLTEGAMVGFWLWLGFQATLSAGNVLWGGKPVKLYYLGNAYQLVAMLLMGAIIVAL